jgi:hypothetical protein
MKLESKSKVKYDCSHDVLPFKGSVTKKKHRHLSISDISDSRLCPAFKKKISKKYTAIQVILI